MLALLVLAVLLTLVVILGEWFDARSQRRYGVGGPAIDSRRSQLPEPLVPSTVQRSSGGG
jgi:hypothetical protein